MTDDADSLRSGRAWNDFCEALKGAGRDILRDGALSAPLAVRLARGGARSEEVG